MTTPKDPPDDNRPKKRTLGCTFFKNPSGEEPVRTWIKAQPAKARKIIGRDLGSVQDRWPISKPLVEYIGKGMWECRSTSEKVEYRVVFVILDGKLILLNGFVKKTRTTPKAERELALARKREGEKPK